MSEKEVKERIKEVKFGPSDLETLDKSLEKNNSVVIEDKSGNVIGKAKIYVRTQKLDNDIYNVFNYSPNMVTSYQTTIISEMSSDSLVAATKSGNYDHTEKTERDVFVESNVYYTEYNFDGVKHYGMDSTSTYWTVQHGGISMDNERTLIVQAGPNKNGIFRSQRATVYYNDSFWANIAAQGWYPVNTIWNTNVGTISMADFTHYSGSTFTVRLENEVVGNMGALW